MLDDNLRFDTIWNLSELPIESQTVLQRVKEKTKHNTWITLIIALVYWWQDEIVRATKRIIESWINANSLTKERFKEYLDTSSLPNPDLIIRTWWNIRHSGFMLFDSEYSEYHFTERNWPEFDDWDLDTAINNYNDSKRNFGK